MPSPGLNSGDQGHYEYALQQFPECGNCKKYPPESMDSGGLQEKLQSKYFY
ncbi:hypothetical protein HMPREF0372_03591 [Flavonifractor plautii ATCC 29863]|uniref:Uncharacterized protein n=1 Tax=Flavonifractor plautii ATCC 29863 TaxID=411475 RepID=G9YVM6_FLAPL|nr:hypothetical protein HMPREF0372_03591 [Flavonifractor plautii ATCC 29863]